MLLAFSDLNQSVGKPVILHFKLHDTDKKSIASLEKRTLNFRLPTASQKRLCLSSLINTYDLNLKDVVLFLNILVRLLIFSVVVYRNDFSAV